MAGRIVLLVISYWSRLKHQCIRTLSLNEFTSSPYVHTIDNIDFPSRSYSQPWFFTMNDEFKARSYKPLTDVENRSKAGVDDEQRGGRRGERRVVTAADDGTLIV